MLNRGNIDKQSPPRIYRTESAHIKSRSKMSASQRYLGFESMNAMQNLLEENQNANIHFRKKPNHRNNFCSDKKSNDRHLSERNLFGYAQAQSNETKLTRLYRNRSDQKRIVKNIIRSSSDSKVKNKLGGKQDEFLIRIPKNEKIIDSYITQLQKLRAEMKSQKSSGHTVSKSIDRKLRKTDLHSGSIEKNEMIFNEQQDVVRKDSIKIVKAKGQKEKITDRNKKAYLSKLKAAKKGLAEIDQSPSLNDRCQHQTPIMLRNKFDQKTIFREDQNNDVKRKLWPSNSDKNDNKNCYNIIIHQKQVVNGDLVTISMPKVENQLSEILNAKKSKHKSRKLFHISKSTQLRKPQSRIEGDSSAINGAIRYAKNDPPLSSVSKSLNMRKHNKGMNDFQSQEDYENSKKLDNPNKNQIATIEQLSTIQQNKETLEFLGESCSNIAEGLLNSDKKMDKIIDLLNCSLRSQNNEEKNHEERNRRSRKASFEKFSKAFPQGFFKN